MDISNFIKLKIGDALVEESNRIMPFRGAYRKFDDFLERCRRRFPDEHAFQNSKDAIKLINYFVGNKIRIKEDFIDNQTQERSIVYTLTQITSDRYYKYDSCDETNCREKMVERENDKVKSTKSIPAILKFAYFGEYKIFLKMLAEYAVAETWSFKDDCNPHGILNQYLNTVFERLEYEGKIVIINTGNYRYREKGKEVSYQGSICAFNTGLLSRKNGKYIYLVFIENDRVNVQPWKYILMTDDIKTQSFLPFKDNIPQLADFYKDTQSKSYVILMRDFTAINKDHIILSHCERLPIDFLKKYFQGFFKNRKTNMDNGKDWDEFKAYMKNNNSEYQQAKAWLNTCIEHAQIRAKNGDKYRVMIYRPETKKYAFFIPVFFNDPSPKDDSKCDVGIIVDNENGSYIVRTIYQLSMAYPKIRVLGNQDRTWLRPEKIIKWRNPYDSNGIDNI